jgi:hypothetical protein
VARLPITRCALGRRRKGVRARHVEVHIVPKERHVGEKHEDDRPRRPRAARQPSTPTRTRHGQPDPQREEEEQGAEDDGEPREVADVTPSHRSVTTRVVRKSASMDSVR